MKQHRPTKKQNMWSTVCLAILTVFVAAVILGLFFDSRESRQASPAHSGTGFTANLRSGCQPAADDRICTESNYGILCVRADSRIHDRRGGSRMARQLDFSVNSMLRRADSGITQGMNLTNLRLLQQGHPDEHLLKVENVRLLI